MPSFEEKVASGRVPCCVPGCRRTFKDGGEVLCGQHWRSVPPHLRRRVSKLRTMYRCRYGDAGFWTFPPGSEKRMGALRLARLFERAWALCKAAAIERSMGL